MDPSDMKKLLFAVFALVSALAGADPYDVTVRQRSAADTGYLDRFVKFPGTGESCLFSLDGPSILPSCYTLGTGLSLSSGVVSASAVDLSAYATNAALGSGLATKYNTPLGTTAQYVRGDGSLATLPGASAFNFGAPAAKTVAVSTAYQAADITKAAIVTVSPSCQNATTVLASSACTLTLRQSSAAGLTCASGTVAATWTSTVQLGLVFTQTSGSPFDVKLPIGGYFILCASSGTFTISAVEQSAG